MGKTTKDKRDVYYRKAKEEGLRARSAFKLLQIDLKFDIFKSHVTNVLDLCAAPGGWSQVVSKKLLKENYQDVKIVAVDLQPMAPLPGVIQIQDDITKPSTINRILSHFNGCKVDLILCDGAPDVIGLMPMDVNIQIQLLIDGIKIAHKVLKKGGNFVAKIYRGKTTATVTSQLSQLFKEVVIAKPTCSRNSSIEAFVVCLNYTPSENTSSLQINQFLSKDELNKTPFVACGEYNAFDADATYELQLADEELYQYREPVQSPIAPPYCLSNAK
ncbi:hypothetical protein FQA39_LY07161 [Lamprigera yunnana]|nr:hypothetical protein FQA39_LY07161 [Lamprigera yunnana]